MLKRNLLLAAVSGVILALAMPKPGIAPLAWIGLAPLLLILRDARWSRAALYGFVAGFVYFAIILYWICLFGCLPWLLLAAAQAAYYAVFAAAASFLMPSRIGWWGFVAVPAAWTAMQWTRSLGLYALPWGGMSHLLADDAYLIQLAALTGAWGIEFLVCFANLALAEGLLQSGRKRLLPIAVAASLIAATYLVGFAIVQSAPTGSGTARIAIIQQNLPHGVVPEEGYVPNSFATCTRMSLDAAEQRPDLIIWPETAITEDLTGTEYETLILALARQTGSEFLIGGYDPCRTRRGSHNAAHLYGARGRKLGVYRKVHLVPFGEFVPLRDWLPFLDNYSIRAEDVVPGAEHVLLRSKIGRLGIGICFESLFPQIAQLETRRGANVLVVTTNDSWFGRTQAARQHLMIAKLRAVENRRYVVRAALTGISAIIDPYGRTVSELGVLRRGIVSGDIRPLAGMTPFTMLGQWFAYLCAGVVLVSLARARATTAGQPSRVGLTARSPRHRIGAKL